MCLYPMYVPVYVGIYVRTYEYVALYEYIDFVVMFEQSPILNANRHCDYSIDCIFM